MDACRRHPRCRYNIGISARPAGSLVKSYIKFASRRTAKALGLTVPDLMIVRADEVIE